MSSDAGRLDTRVIFDVESNVFPGVDGLILQSCTSHTFLGDTITVLVEYTTNGMQSYHERNTSELET